MSDRADNKKKIYATVIQEVFFAHYKKGIKEFGFSRAELVAAGAKYGVAAKNIGDVPYTYRYRRPLPEPILKTCEPDQEWLIEGAGTSQYHFRLVAQVKVAPRGGLRQIKVPAATPEIVEKYALGDEQALLAKLRYNRLIDIFTGVTAYSLQNHLRTNVAGIGQIEVDELYVGVNQNGVHFIIPVQAKGGSDRLSVVQMKQDIAFCRERFPNLVCRSVASQFLGSRGDRIAMFEIALKPDGLIEIVEERHYKLVPASEITDEDLRGMARRPGETREPN